MNQSGKACRLILASASPRRAELLRQIGVSFEQRPVDLDESVAPDESPETYVKRLALEKARAAFELAGSGDEVRVLGSDTSVVLGSRILGKPTHEADAREMLMALAGREHQVLTAVALVGANVEAVELVSTSVWFRSIENAEIRSYWLTGEPQDKAGGYAIQGRGAMFIRRIEGSYSAVMGLPLFETAQLLANAGFDLWSTAGERQ